MVTAEREQLILSLLDHVTPLVRKLAREWHLEYEDLYQDVSINLMRLVDRPLDHIRNLPAVASYCTRQLIINRWRSAHRHQACSLEAPLTSDTEVSLVDLLPSPYSAQPEYMLLAKERLEELRESVVDLRGMHGKAVRDRYEAALAAYC